MQIIGTLGKLRYSDRELALKLIVGCVFQIEIACCCYEAHQGIVLIRIEGCLQIKRVLSVFIILMQNGGIKGILLLDAVFSSGGVFYPPGSAIEVKGVLCRISLQPFITAMLSPYIHQ